MVYIIETCHWNLAHNFSILKINHLQILLAVKNDIIIGDIIILKIFLINIFDRFNTLTNPAKPLLKILVAIF